MQITNIKGNFHDFGVSFFMCSVKGIMSVKADGFVFKEGNDLIFHLFCIIGNNIAI